MKELIWSLLFEISTCSIRRTKDNLHANVGKVQALILGFEADAFAFVFGVCVDHAAAGSVLGALFALGSFAEIYIESFELCRGKGSQTSDGKKDRKFHSEGFDVEW